MRKYLPFLFIALCSLSFKLDYKPFELIGKVTTEQGFVIPEAYIQISKKGKVIAQTKTDNFGNYVLPLSKIGKYTIIVGNKLKYFHPKEKQQYNFNLSTQFEESFTLKIDKQVLQDECARLRKSFKHMVHNSKNMTYRRSFLNRFPRSGLELELFFSSNVKAVNLKKEAKRYVQTVFQENFTGRHTYINMFLDFSQHTDMRVAGKNTKKYYAGAIPIINKNKEILFSEFEHKIETKVSKFFIWMFSGEAYGKKKMKKNFDYLAPKYPEVHTLMLNAYDVYLNGE